MNNILEKKDPKKKIKYQILDYIRKNMMSILPDKLYLKIMYKLKTRHKLNLDNPQRYTEKLQWLKLYDRKDIYTNYADKYKVREIVKKEIGEEHLIKLFGVYDKFEDIDFTKLPDKFVLKCNHDSGSVIICTDKNTFDYEYARKKLTKALNNDYYIIGREYIYKDIERKIMIEEYLDDLVGNSANDYKIFIINGELSHIEICSNRFTNLRVTFFDKNKKLIRVSEMGEKYDESIELPSNVDEMINCAKKIAKNIPVLRVDFYNLNGRIYFGEVAFFDCSGFATYDKDEFDFEIGRKIKLPKNNMGKRK